jgi:hypothetical protein
MWFWIVVAVIAVAVYGLLRWRERGGGGPRNIYQTKSDLLRRPFDPGNIDRHKGKRG